MKFFFHNLEIFISKEKCRNIPGSEMCTVKYYYSVCSHNQVSFIHSYDHDHTIKFHSYDHDNVLFKEKISNFHFSCRRYYTFKSCLKILKIFKDFPKNFSECAKFTRDRRSTNLTENIVTAVAVTMNSTLDNTEVLYPHLKLIFKN